MPPSNSLLDNRYFKQLAVNRLEAQAIQSDNISSQTPSYLFSAVFDNATFDRNSTGGTLTIDSNFIKSIIRFSDRPLRLSAEISFDEFVSLFSILDSGSNTFDEDPPNAVLVHKEEQRTYIVKLLSSDLNSVIFNLELLPGETHNMNTVNGSMNLFVDGLTLNESLQDKLSSLEVNKSYKITYYPDLPYFGVGPRETRITYGIYNSSDNSNYNFSGNIAISKIGLNVIQYIESNQYISINDKGSPVYRPVSVPTQLGSLKDIQQIPYIPRSFDIPKSIIGLPDAFGNQSFP
jgi:hypothetical protein